MQSPLASVELLVLGRDYCPVDQHQRINVASNHTYRLSHVPVTAVMSSSSAPRPTDECSHDVAEFGFQWDPGMGRRAYIMWVFSVCEHGEEPILLYQEPREVIGRREPRLERGSLTPYQRGFLDSPFCRSWSELHKKTHGEIMEGLFREANAQGRDLTRSAWWSSATRLLSDP